MLAAGLSACGTSAVYQPFNYDRMHGRSALMLESVHLPPIPKGLHTRIVNRLEAEFARSPHLRQVTTRAAFKERMRADKALGRNYRLVSETLAVVGIAERQSSQSLGRKANAELLIMMQTTFSPCPRCLEGSQLALVAAVVEAETGILLWRAHFLQSMDDESEEALAAELEELLQDLVDTFEEDLRPKWQRQRFKALGGEAPA